MLLIQRCPLASTGLFCPYETFAASMIRPELAEFRLTSKSRKVALFRESIAYPYMDFQKSTGINMDIHDFWMSFFNYPWISTLISKQ